MKIDQQRGLVIEEAFAMVCVVQDVLRWELMCTFSWIGRGVGGDHSG
jgi:hypothetical protein